MRKCPYCLASVSPAVVDAYSDSLVCSGCNRALEIAPISRNLASIAGLVAGALAWHFSKGELDLPTTLGWVLPVLYSFLAYSLVSPLVLMLMADLRLRSSQAGALAPERESGPGQHAVHH